MAHLDDPARLKAFTPQLFSPTDDPILDDIVRSAARDAEAPIALVSMVMEKVQFFRAHTGLPADLAVARATDRCDSFCQFVVATEAPFQVTDAASDVRVPKKLVAQYGVAAYLGVPIWYAEQVVGSLCVIDIKPRQFTPGLQQALVRYAARASARLAELAAHIEVDPTPVPSLSDAVDTARSIERALAEVASVIRLIRSEPNEDGMAPTLAVLKNAAFFYDDVHERVTFLRQQLVQLQGAIK